jgi:predicted nucleic acid-binding Zn ribbon protein
VSAESSDEDVDEMPITPLSTKNGGKSPSVVDSGHVGGVDNPPQSSAEHVTPGSDLARSALTDARQIARARPGRMTARQRRADTARGRRGGYSGPAPDETDPQRVGRLLAGYVEDRGWQLPLAEARVSADWAVLVGDEVAAHSVPMTLHDGELKVSAESTAWATQLRLLATAVLARLTAELGPDVVTRLIITGPVGPSWKHGGFSVRGTRGPRDTYG